jgi:hypothetical protein
MMLPRLSLRRRKGTERPDPRHADLIFRRFFTLIGRLERPQRAAPETKARITRLDDPSHRPS